VAAVLDGLPAPAVGTGESQTVGLGALSLAMLAVSVDGTVLSVALPTLARALYASESDLQWFSQGYFLVLTADMLPAVQADFARGMDMALLVSADIALAGIVFTLPFLSASNAPKKAAQPVMDRW